MPTKNSLAVVNGKRKYTLPDDSVMNEARFYGFTIKYSEMLLLSRDDQSWAFETPGEMEAFLWGYRCAGHVVDVL